MGSGQLIPRHFYRLCLGLVLAGTLTACHREPHPTPEAPAPKKGAGVSIDSATPNSAPTPPPPATVDAAPTSPGENEPTGEVSIEKLNAALKQYIVISPNLPDDLAELYRAKLIPKVPVPPPGKQYVVDKKKAQVLLVNQ